MRAKNQYKIIPCNDKELIKRLHRKIFPTDVWYDELSYDWIVVDHSGKPVGFCMLSKWDSDIVYMARAGLLPCAQKKGLHMRMIRVRERFSRSQGFKKIITYTKVHNVQSMVNLQKAGFLIYLPVKQYADPDCVYWMRDL